MLERKNRYFQINMRALSDYFNVQTEIDHAYTLALFAAYVLFLSSLFFLNSLVPNQFFLYFLAPVMLAPTQWKLVAITGLSIPVPARISFCNIIRNINLCFSPLAIAIIIYVFNKAILTYLVPAPDTHYLYYLDTYLPPLLLYFIATIRLCVDMPNFYEKFFQCVGPIVAINASINIFNHFQALPNISEFQAYRLEPMFGAGVNTHAATAAGFTYALYLYALIILITKNKTKIIQLVNYCSMIMLIFALILAQARGALVGLSLALFVISVISSKKARYKIIASLIIINSLFMAFPQIRSFAISRGDTFRLEVWAQFLTVTKKWFIFGFGDRGFGEKDLFSITVSSGEQVHHAHNILFNALWRGGMIGFITLSYVLIGGIYKSFCYFKVTSDAIPLGLILMLSISGMVDFEAHLFPAPWLWTSVWLPMLFAIGSEAKMKFQEYKEFL
jgi:hypothetical protein